MNRLTKFVALLITILAILTVARPARADRLGDLCEVVGCGIQHASELVADGGKGLRRHARRLPKCLAAAKCPGARSHAIIP